MKYLFFTFLLFAITSADGQIKIKLLNPSFEGKKSRSHLPHGWIDCGVTFKKGESPPDTQPGSWKVNKKASKGETYVGLVTRDVGTNEFITQKLTAKLLANTCYSFSLDLAKSKEYISNSQLTHEVASYSRDVIIRIWGSNTKCDREELLAASFLVSHQDWRPYPFILKPKNEFSYIIIEAYFDTDKKERYNGHLLVDNASDIIPIECPQIENQ